jgi:hypothetical protein
MKIKLDGDRPSCVEVDPYPNLPEGALPQQAIDAIARYLRRWNGSPQAEFLGSHLFADGLLLSIVRSHPLDLKS